jgi:predicted Zn-dependent peptidase
MAKTFLHYNSFENSQAVYQRIEKLTAHDLWDIANELFTPDNLTTLMYK